MLVGHGRAFIYNNLHVFACFIRQRTGKAGFQLIWSNTLIWWRSKEVGWSSPVGISYLTNMLGTPWSRHTTLVTFCPPFPLPGRLYNKPLELGPAPSYYPSRNGCATKQHVFNFPCTFWKAAALFSFFSEKRRHQSWNRPNLVESSRVFCCAFHCGIMALLVGGGRLQYVNCTVCKFPAASVLHEIAWAFGWATYSNVPLSQHHAYYSVEVRIDDEFGYTGGVGCTVWKSHSLTALIDPSRHCAELGCRC